MDVDPEEKEQMERLLKIMNGQTPAPLTSKNVTVNNLTEKEAATNDMKKILESFYSVASPVKQQLNERARVDRELREALNTQPTSHGAKVGNWEIVVNEDENGLKTFDIMNPLTEEVIAKDLSLYDAAYGIVRALNNNEGINSVKVREILITEAEYFRSRQNAAEFKERATRYNNEERRSIMEDRYDDALSRAKLARNRIATIIKE